MIVSSTGFGFTGSTAITDLISEYDGIYTPKVPSYELGFFTDSRGIFNLYDKMVTYNIPDLKYYAGKEYIKQCEEWAKDSTIINYNILFGEDFLKKSIDYLDALGGEDFYYNHDWSDNTELQKIVFRIINKIYTVYNSFKYKNGYGEQNIKPLTLFSKKEKNYLYNVTEERFVECTKKYFNDIFGALAEQGLVNLHGFIPIQAIDECSRYFDDLRVIATERDPRDIYLTAKKRWMTANYPCHDVNLYCKYYRWLRSSLKEEKQSNVLKIQFEDLIYKYDETVSKIEKFLDINTDAHVNAKTKFIPEMSIKGCNLKKKYPEEAENIQVIEEELTEWLYEFE